MFGGRHFPKDIILLCVRWYLAYPLSYRNTEGMMAERGVTFAVEQGHRFIKRIVRPMMGFKAFHSAVSTWAGIELYHMLKKGQ